MADLRPTEPTPSDVRLQGLPIPALPPDGRDCAGPFLCYDNVSSRGLWTGSVLFLTRQGGAEAPPAAVNSSGSSAAAAGSVEPAPDGGSSVVPAADQREAGVAQHPPRLMIEDSFLSPAASSTAGADAGGAGGAGPAPQPPPLLLDSCLGWQFWRFDLELELGEHERPVSYSIEWGAASSIRGGGSGSDAAGGSPAGGDGTGVGAEGAHSPPAATAAAATGCTETFRFWLPARHGCFHAAYHSCNGFSTSVKATAPERTDPDYLWRDLLSLHSCFPHHVLIGGGDQLYNDGVWRSPSLQAWIALDSRTEKLAAPWTEEMQQEVTDFYLHNYKACFMQPTVRQALASIPSVNQWDDHDIWDGWGSYPDAMQDCPVFQGMFAVALRFYLLFQHHTTPQLNQQRQELFGEGEYHFLKWLGPEVALLGIDMRTKRRKTQILPEATYELLRRELGMLRGSVQHLIVLSGVPLVFPHLPWAEEMLETVACIGKSNRLVRKMARTTGLMDPYVGAQPEILDDLVDGWSAEIHKAEKLRFIRLLQEVAERQGVRVTVLSGDAHVGGVGQLYSRPKIKDASLDPKFMPQIVSSAIMNAPPPFGLIRLMHRANYARNVDKQTREKMVRLFRSRHRIFHKLIAKRNWCDISLLVPPAAPPMHPVDAQYGSLRFSLRCEDAKHRRGHAEEIYDVSVPRLRAKHKAVTVGKVGAAAAAATVQAAPAGPGEQPAAGAAAAAASSGGAVAAAGRDPK